MGFLLAVVTPILIVLSALFGVGVGWLFVSLVRTPPPHIQRQRDRELAKATARKTAEETIRRIFDEAQ